MAPSVQPNVHCTHITRFLLQSVIFEQARLKLSCRAVLNQDSITLLVGCARVFALHESDLMQGSVGKTGRRLLLIQINSRAMQLFIDAALGFGEYRMRTKVLSNKGVPVVQLKRL